MNISHPLIELQTVDSTNLYAEQLLRVQRVPEGTIIFAHEQTSGKGQGKSSWESEPGKNATFSIILFPVFLHPEQQFLMNEMISLGVLDLLNRLQIQTEFSIKWPNDIYAGKRKIGGILIQNTICGSTYESCIAGIGLNINQESFPAWLPDPSSMKLLTGITYPVKETIDLITERIEERYLQLKEGFIKTLNRDYQEHLLQINKRKKYLVNKKVVNGAIMGVDKMGRLKFLKKNGSMQYLNHGEIEFVFH